MWRTGSTGDWYSAADFRGLRDEGFVKAPDWLAMAETDATERVLASRNREAVLRVLAALDQWRTMTVQQIEALTDLAGLTAGNRSLVSAMWNAGMVDICEMGSTFKAGERHRDALLLRPARAGAALDAFEARLSYPEWVSATAGLGFDADRQFARHNIMATELGLRVAEFGQAATVLGEKLSSMSLLAYSGVGDKVPSTGASRGSDLTLVRGDGLRIAVEMTASLSGGYTGFSGKVERLVRILASRPHEVTGLSVLFVVAPRKEASTDPRDVLDAVKRLVQKAVHTYPGTAADPTAARVGVASWTGLFPAAHSAVRDFGKLPYERPTGPGYRGDLDDDRVWEKAYFLDPASTPFTARDRDALTAVVGNAAGLRGVPHMLRTSAARPVLSDLTVQAMGLERVPQVKGTKPVTVGRGVSGVPSLPARLTY
jgi:hypothetical protein